MKPPARQQPQYTRTEGKRPTYTVTRLTGRFGHRPLHALDHMVFLAAFSATLEVRVVSAMEPCICITMNSLLPGG
jgi:hypothetical protein